ncbi:bifunctional helix-turn-helix transcriptional regulator/GNAT family N-acetyltransferase [Enterovibrio nigricans]|uniref:Transcriptional regulator, MarR family with acetyltransferase activity n=1 Tax=Enterovibrio nigricans DSM 22720 TaxID=1121868 RepID=A0A1T4UPN3_9GAMM|nr:bifunctional helix-turn-helix transcriptional regulator/GNAT family N-acetyltransferase [Enterovibrio nigricans]PKF50368.1 MarR family transcriptional regulator [Enterovibrio nigricans]SKA54586.1 transcriptional regulator, MarR family with acetyltransferase activity [Enterovibrio nigricans DSM 22720]
MATGAVQIRQLVRQLLRHRGLLDNIYGTTNLTTVQCHVLIELENEALSASEIASRLNIDVANANRTLAILINNDNVLSHASPESVQPTYSLSDTGRTRLREHHQGINQQITGYLEQLDSDEIETLSCALHRYNRAMLQTEQQSGYTVRRLEPADNAAIANVIRKVSAEYGLTADKGYSVSDPTLDALSECYKPSNAAYWVIEKDGKIWGGGGIAPLSGEDDVCELQKMYIRPELRGRGFARRLAATAMKFAREKGYTACYLETTACLKEAISLYESMGFHHLDAPLGNTGHCDCEVAMLKRF